MEILQNGAVHPRTQRYWIPSSRQGSYYGIPENTIRPDRCSDLKNGHSSQNEISLHFLLNRKQHNLW